MVGYIILDQYPTDGIVLPEDRTLEAYSSMRRVSSIASKINEARTEFDPRAIVVRIRFTN